MYPEIIVPLPICMSFKERSTEMEELAPQGNHSHLQYTYAVLQLIRQAVLMSWHHGTIEYVTNK